MYNTLKAHCQPASGLVEKAENLMLVRAQLQSPDLGAKSKGDDTTNRPHVPRWDPLILCGWCAAIAVYSRGICKVNPLSSVSHMCSPNPLLPVHAQGLLTRSAPPKISGFTFTKQCAFLDPSLYIYSHFVHFTRVSILSPTPLFSMQ